MVVCQQGYLRAVAFDIYVSTRGSVKLLDINPWGWTTQPLLFTWQELEDLAAPAPLHEHVPLEPDAHSPGCKQDQARIGGTRAESSEASGVPRGSRVVMRVVEDAAHIQPGAAVVTGAPADVHLHLGGVAWNDVMALLQRESACAGE